ncbi:MAG: Bax inhibitor-1/YccA family protein [Gammaproteobacteria bacterium]|nr:Bax inhibitor-1/YccA family protein [Gammaproteobacteria bacterium]MCD8542526.1 Bax inhibitor-1/YccA family protein [Gammaproteobacteria bacterium]
MNFMKSQAFASATRESLVAEHSVLRNTYLLLSLTILFSAVMASVAIATRAAPMGLLFSLVGMFGFCSLTKYLRNSAWGLLSVFGFTGFMGYMLGPIVGVFLQSYANGGFLVMSALGTTGVTFFGLSMYALTTKKTFSALGGFLSVGLLVVIVGSVANIFLKMPAIYLTLSVATSFIASGLILFDTARIIHGGERNYIMATISLYLDIYMLFVNLLQLFAVFGGRER